MDINELHKLAEAGDRASEEELFCQLTARFSLFVKQRLWDRADAEEVVQEAVKTIFEKYRQIEFESSFAAWAYRVLNNKLLTFTATKGRREKKIEEQIEQRQTIRDENTENTGDLEARLLACLNDLNRANTRHARILNLHYQGFTVKEICTRLGLTRTNFYTILSRARTMLAACLEKGEVK